MSQQIFGDYDRYIAMRLPVYWLSRYMGAVYGESKSIPALNGNKGKNDVNL